MWNACLALQQSHVQYMPSLYMSCKRKVECPQSLRGKRSRAPFCHKQSGALPALLKVVASTDFSVCMVAALAALPPPLNEGLASAEGLPAQHRLFKSCCRMLMVCLPVLECQVAYSSAQQESSIFQVTCIMHGRSRPEGECSLQIAMTTCDFAQPTLSINLHCRTPCLPSAELNMTSACPS